MNFIDAAKDTLKMNCANFHKNLMSRGEMANISKLVIFITTWYMHSFGRPLTENPCVFTTVFSLVAETFAFWFIILCITLETIKSRWLSVTYAYSPSFATLRRLVQDPGRVLTIPCTESRASWWAIRPCTDYLVESNGLMVRKAISFVLKS